MSHINRITYDIIGAAIRIHRRLGSGLLESAYHDLMFRDLVKSGYYVESKKRIGFEFEGSWIENGLRTDLIVERCVIVELKVAVAVAPVHERQLLPYLRLTGLPVGLLINFGAEMIYQGIRRLVNNLQEE